MVNSELVLCLHVASGFPMHHSLDKHSGMPFPYKPKSVKNCLLKWGLSACVHKWIVPRGRRTLRDRIGQTALQSAFERAMQSEIERRNYAAA